MKVGDILIMKPLWLMQRSFPLTANKAEIIEYSGAWDDGFELVLQNCDWELKTYRGFISKNAFYLPTSINMELLQLLSGEIEFVSFEGKTVDGKMINLSL